MHPKQVPPMQQHDYCAAAGQQPNSPPLVSHYPNLYHLPLNFYQIETKIGTEHGLPDNSFTFLQSQRRRSANIQENSHKTQSLETLEKEKKINEHRNNVPNQLNQVVTILTHPSQFDRCIRPIFEGVGQLKYAQAKLFCHYMKNIQSVNQRSRLEKFLQNFFEIHSSDFEVYPREQQQLFMKVARIFIWKFLNSEAVVNVLRSRKMHKNNKPSHLQSIRYLRITFIRFCRQKQC